MAKFKVGVDIEQVRVTTITVEVEANDLDEAEKKALAGTDKICRMPTTQEGTLGISSFHGWDTDHFSCLGICNDECGGEDYNTDLEIT